MLVISNIHVSVKNIKQYLFGSFHLFSANMVFLQRLVLVLLMVVLLQHSSTVAAKSTEDKKESSLVSLSAPKSVKKFLIKYFELPGEPLADETAESTFLRRAQQEISVLLATEGYFTPSISMTRRSQKLDDIKIKVDPGARTLVEKVNIEFRGDLVNDEPESRKRIEQFRSAWLLKIDEPFRSSDWEEAKAALLSSLTDKYYAAAHIVESEVIVDPENAQARLSIIIDSGPVFYLGDMVISGLERYDEELVRNFNPYKIGDAYRRNTLLNLQLALQNIPHFNSVSVTIDPDPAQHKAVPVQIVITEMKSQRIAFGLGYSSNNGARGEINFRDQNFLDRAWSLYSTLRLEQKRQTFLAGVDTLPNQDRFRYSLGGSLQMTDIKNLKTVNQRVSFNRIYQSETLLRQLGLTWQREEKRPSGGINQTATALALDWRWRYHKIDDPVHIRRGIATEVRIGGGSQHVLSDQDFIRTYARHQNWWPVGKRDVLFLRAEAGYTLAKSRFGIPQEYLFRAGGIQSVRGYDFLSLGVREGNAIVGGRTMATGTLEYNHWFMQNWGAAVFTDIGSATDSWKELDLALGYGAGVRWRSPAGPLALDLARGHKSGNLRVHFSMGVVF